MEPENHFLTPIQRNYDRLFLCREVLEQVQFDLERPEIPDELADLLLISEALALEIGKLHRRVYKMVWNEEYNSDSQIIEE